MPTRGTSLLKKKSIKNEKLYGRSSQSFRITPGNLQQFLSLTPSTTHTSTSSTTHYIQHFPRYPHHHLSCSSPNHQQHHYSLLPQHRQISSNHPLYHPHNHLFFLFGFSFTAICESQGCREGGGHFFSSSPPLLPASRALRHRPGGFAVSLPTGF